MYHNGTHAFPQITLFICQNQDSLCHGCVICLSRRKNVPPRLGLPRLKVPDQCNNTTDQRASLLHSPEVWDFSQGLRESHQHSPFLQFSLGSSSLKMPSHNRGGEARSLSGQANPQECKLTGPLASLYPRSLQMVEASSKQHRIDRSL